MITRIARRWEALCSTSKAGAGTEKTAGGHALEKNVIELLQQCLVNTVTSCITLLLRIAARYDEHPRIRSRAVAAFYDRAGPDGVRGFYIIYRVWPLVRWERVETPLFVKLGLERAVRIDIPRVGDAGGNSCAKGDPCAEGDSCADKSIASSGI